MKAATVTLTLNGTAKEISIHAAREGGDAGTVQAVFAKTDISIHAAREGGDVPAERL